MKTASTVKFLLTLCLFLTCIVLPAQQNSETKEPFIRIYNLQGQKVLKGRVAGVTANTISLRRGDKMREIDIAEIGFIRTKHSVGNNVLIGASAGAAISAVTFAAAADPDILFFGYTAAEGLVGGFVLGAPLGAGIGALTALFKKSEQYEINGQEEKWIKIMPYFQR